MNKLDFPDTAPRTPPDSTAKQVGPTIESFLRLIIFALVGTVCAFVTSYVLSPVHNPKQVFPEGFGFVVGIGILCGILAVAESCVFLWRLGSHGLESWWK